MIAIHLRVAVAIAALLALGGCATPAQPAAAQSVAEPGKSTPSRSSEDCLFSVVVKDWAPIDEQRFIIYGLTKHEAYLGKLFFPTPDLINDVGMSVIDADRNGRICGQSTDAVEFRNSTIPGRNLITSLHKISDAEAKALLEESKAKKNKPGIPAEPVKQP
jgi:Family of unknown function (DUF6491)